MKKVIYIVSFLVMVLAFGGVAANAQSATKIDANIPFDFVVGDKVLSAGKYVIRLRRAPSGAQAMEVRNSDNKVVYDAFALENGDRGKDKAELVFDKSNGQATLAKIRTEGKGFTVPVEKSADVIAAKERKKSSGIQN